MTGFEYLLICLMIPIAYVVVYIAGKFDVITLFIQMLTESVERYNRKNNENTRTLTIEYETFPEDDMTVLSVVDPETDTAIFMANNEEADKLYEYLTQYEQGRK